MPAHQEQVRQAALDENPTSVQAKADAVSDVPKVVQLPAAVTNFTGRQSSIDHLVDLLSSGEEEGVPVAVISGIQGVGKTALAVHVAHTMHARFPDGQLYAELRGYDQEPATPESVLAGFLRAFGMPANLVPEGLAERSALFRSLLANRRILLLLDNVKDAAQVHMLLPGTPGCAAIVTSRHKLADLTSANLIDLDVMKPDEALALFTAVVGSERVGPESTAAMDIVAACGFRPLVVRIVAAKLASELSWTVASLRDRITGKGKPASPYPNAERFVSFMMRLLPAQHRSRYVEELKAELHHLAQAKATPAMQVVYVLQQFARVWNLREALRAPDQSRFHRIRQLVCWVLASNQRTWCSLGSLLAFAAVNVCLSQGWGSVVWMLPTTVSFHAGVEWLRRRWGIELKPKLPVGDPGRDQ